MIQYAGCARVRVARCEVQQQCNKATTVEKTKGGNGEGENTRVYTEVRESARKGKHRRRRRERERERGRERKREKTHPQTHTRTRTHTHPTTRKHTHTHKRTHWRAVSFVRIPPTHSTTRADTYVKEFNNSFRVVVTFYVAPESRASRLEVGVFKEVVWVSNRKHVAVKPEHFIKRCVLYRDHFGHAIAG